MSTSNWKAIWRLRVQIVSILRFAIWPSKFVDSGKLNPRCHPIYIQEYRRATQLGPVRLECQTPEPPTAHPEAGNLGTLAVSILRPSGLQEGGGSYD